MAGQRATAPVHRDVGEEPVLDLVPLRRARRQVADRDDQPGFRGQAGEVEFPGPGAIAVGPARIGSDQQPGSLRVVGPALAVPPAADRLHRERGGVVVGADIDPAGVRRQVVDAVRDGLAQQRIGEVVDADRHRIACGPPGTASVVEVADQLSLLGVHADHRLAGIPVITCLLVEIPELGIPVGMLAALERLGIGLQPEPLLPQQTGDSVRTDPVALTGQLGRQRAGRLLRPPQRRHRITTFVRLDQAQQGTPQSRVEVRDAFASAARPPHPPGQELACLQVGHALANRCPAHPGRPGHGPNATMTQSSGLRGHQQPPLPFVQVRKQHRELHGKLITNLIRDAHTTPTSPSSESNTLMIGTPLVSRKPVHGN
ncbi:hypothetical protein EES46_24045 [Streptomyces sp. ADI98-10]|nr:hypothetical protein EES46_24045 [Streptomyces sp. ADI98-10]